TLSGKKVTGDIAELTSQAIVIRAADGEVRSPISDVLLLEIGPDVPTKEPATDVELTDGTILHCLDVKVKGKTVDLKLLSLIPVSVPLSAVTTIIRDSHDPGVKQDWQQLMAKRGPRDLLVVRTDGKLDTLEGTFGDGTETGESVNFTLAANDQRIQPKL